MLLRCKTTIYYQISIIKYMCKAILLYMAWFYRYFNFHEVKSNAILCHMAKIQHSGWFVMACCLHLHDAGFVFLLTMTCKVHLYVKLKDLMYFNQIHLFCKAICLVSFSLCNRTCGQSATVDCSCCVVNNCMRRESQKYFNSSINLKKKFFREVYIRNICDN